MIDKMCGMVSKLISILLVRDTKIERKLFPAKIKYQILAAQKNKCVMCNGLWKDWIENLTTKTEIVPTIRYQIVKHYILDVIERNLKGCFEEKIIFLIVHFHYWSNCKMKNDISQ